MQRIGLKRGLLVLALVAGLSMIPVGKSLAWFSPADRPTFTWENAASYITFNSITNNPFTGDERPFLDGRVVGTPGNNLDKITVHDNDELILRVYFHNNAKANLNLVSTNTRVKILLPHAPKTATYAAGYITSDNANPRVVADTVDFVGAREFTMDYIPGSARIKTNALGEVPLSDAVISNTGALIGFNQLDGRVPGCGNFSGWVTIRTKVHMPTPEVPDFACDLLKVTTHPGRKVDASVDFTATGGATLQNVKFSWGDGESTSTSQTTASHTYAKDGNFTIDATLTFDVGETTKTASCSHPVSFSTKTPPVTPPKVTVLPDTGPGSAIGLFAGASALAGVGHYVVSRRRG